MRGHTNRRNKELDTTNINERNVLSNERQKEKLNVLSLDSALTKSTSTHACSRGPEGVHFALSALRLTPKLRHYAGRGVIN